jgi:hypothetical protein
MNKNSAQSRKISHDELQFNKLQNYLVKGNQHEEDDLCIPDLR